MARPGFPFGRRIMLVPVAFDFTGLPLGAYAGVLPGGMNFSSATAGSILSVRDSAATIVQGLSGSLPRVSLDWTTGTSTRGILIEPTTQNRVTTGRDLSTATLGAAGSGETIVSTGTLAGPDGSLGGNVVAVTSGGFSRGLTLAALASTARRTLSCWARATAGAADWQQAETESAGSPAARARAGTLSTTWQLIQVSRNTNQSTTSSATFRFLDGRDYSALGGVTARALSHAVDFLQIEDTGGASSYIQTTGAAATRATPRLWLPGPAAGALIDRGRVGCELAFSLHFAPAAGSTLGRLFSFAGIAPVPLSVSVTSTGFVQLSLKGSSVIVTTTSQLACSPGDDVKLWVECGGSLRTVVKMQVNGGPASTLLDAAPVRDVFPYVDPSITMDLFQENLSTPNNGVVQSATFYPLAQRPAWAA